MMLAILRNTVLSMGMVCLAVPTTVLAQTGGILTFIVPAGQFGSPNFANVLVGSLAAAKRFCGALDSAYQVDCLAERIGALAEEIPPDTDYAEVRSILAKTSADMAKVANANRDRGKARANASSGSISTTRPLTPISSVSIASANQQAAAILDATETLLLRTPDDDSGKKLQYARIAEALGSNKTLLRSA